MQASRRCAARVCSRGGSGLKRGGPIPLGMQAIAAMSIVTRYMMFINSALIGFGQGFQPVCGFNFGAKRYDRVLEAFWFCLKVAVILLTTLGVISFFGAEAIMGLFRKGDLEVSGSVPGPCGSSA